MAVSTGVLMIDRRRLRRDDELETPGSRAPRRETADGSPTRAVLELQERAGNQAVTSLLTASPGAAAAYGLPAVQRDTPKKPEEAKKPKPPPSMQIPDLDLDLAITSFQNKVRGTNEPKTEGGEAVVTMTESGQATTFMKALSSGQHFAIVTIQIGKGTITLHDVVVSQYQVGGDHEVLGFSFGSMEFTGEGSDKGEGTLSPGPYESPTPKF